MNRKIEKQIRKKGKKKRFYLSIFAFIMLLFVPVFVYASEMKSDGKTTQVIEEENKTVRVLTDFMIMRETKGLNEQKDRKADKKKR